MFVLQVPSSIKWEWKITCLLAYMLYCIIGLNNSTLSTVTLCHGTLQDTSSVGMPYFFATRKLGLH